MMMPGWAAGLPGDDQHVSLGDVRFQTGYETGQYAPKWTIGLAELEGWDDSAPDRTETFDHWSGDGAESGLERDGARVIRVRGSISAPDMGSMTAGKDALKRAVGVFVVDDRLLGLAREATVRRPRVLWEQVTPLFERFSLTIVADDPLRYSTATASLANGSNVLVNRGDRDAWPVLEFVGPHNAVSIVHAGGTYQLTALTSGTERTVDLRNGNVWEGGVRVFGAESGPAPLVPAGGADLTVSGLGSGTARVRRFEAWS